MLTLVTGATGRVGSRLVPRLAVSRPLRVLVRDPERAGPFWDGGADVVLGDLRDPDAVKRAVTGVDAVVHLAAAFRGVDAAETGEVTRDATRAARACGARGGRAALRVRQYQPGLRAWAGTPGARGRRARAGPRVPPEQGRGRARAPGPAPRPRPRRADRPVVVRLRPGRPAPRGVATPHRGRPGAPAHPDRAPRRRRPGAAAGVGLRRRRRPGLQPGRRRRADHVGAVCVDRVPGTGRRRNGRPVGRRRGPPPYPRRARLPPDLPDRLRGPRGRRAVARQRAAGRTGA